jgi:predicted ATPase
MARLDRLAPAKEIAQVAAAIGREFSHALLAQVMQILAAQLEQALDELLRAELVSAAARRPRRAMPSSMR